MKKSIVKLICFVFIAIFVLPSRADDNAQELLVEEKVSYFRDIANEQPDSLNSAIDELLTLSFTNKKSRKRLLSEMAKVLYQTKQANAFSYFNQHAFLAAANKGDVESNAMYWLYIKQINQLKDNRKEQLEAMKKAVKIVQGNGLEDIRDNILFHYANAYRANEDFANALSVYQELIDGTEREKSKASAYVEMGSIYRMQARFQEALVVQSDALTIFKALNEELEMANTYYALANTHLFLQNHQQSSELFSAAKQLDVKMGNEFNAAYSAIKLCEVYIYLDKYELAKRECLHGKEVFINKNSASNIAWADSILAILYRAQNKFEDAENVMTDALNKYKSKMRKPLVSSGYLSIAQSQLPQGKYSAALVNAKKALELIEGSEHSDRISKTYQVLGDIYEAQGDFEQSIFYIKEYQKRFNESRAKVNKESIERLQKDINVIKKQKEIELLEHQKEQQEAEIARHQRNIKLGVAIAPFVLWLIYFAFKLQIKKRKLIDKEKALLADLMEKKNQLLADVSHELGTPITVLKLQVEALQDDLEEDVHLTYDSLAAKLVDIERLINDIYQLAQYDIGADVLHLDIISLAQHIRNWGYGVEKLIEHNGLSFNFENKLPEELLCEVDGERISQVLTNLIHNGIKYTDKPGSIQVKAYVDQNCAYIEVEDSSPGVSAKEHSKIFERLYRVDSSRSRGTGGSGLGLAICQSIIEAHHGKIKARDSSLGGLKVIISLPIKSGLQYG